MFQDQTRFEKIRELQKQPKNIRNISIVAHVDHGKTSISDALIATNDIISDKNSGIIRYLDSREDEQLRCITMKSSAISLVHKRKKKEYLINLIDSPGHIEFNYEVSSALRLTDGALVVIDIVEGVSSQTLTVLRQCFEEKLDMILIINKMDRLKTDLKVDTESAYDQIKVLIEETNAFVSQLISVELAAQLKKKTSKKGYKMDKKKSKKLQMQFDKDLEEMEERILFDPLKGNVVFCTAIHQWAFTIETRAKQVSEMLYKQSGNEDFKNPKVVQQFLWGDFYYDEQKKAIFKTRPSDYHVPMFCQFLLEPIWYIYDMVMIQKKLKKTKKIAKNLKIDLPKFLIKKFNKDVSNKKEDNKFILQQIMKQMMPIGEAVFGPCIKCISSPKNAQMKRLKVLCRKLYKAKKDTKMNMKNAIMKCKNKDKDPLIIYISKMVLTKQMNITENNIENQQIQNQFLNKTEQDRFYGFARIFSGKLKKGEKVYVITDTKKKRGKSQRKHSYDILEQEIKSLYLLEGRNLQGIDSISAGNVFGIGSLDNIVYKTGTISNNIKCPSFAPMNIKAEPLLKVSVEALDFDEMPKLQKGLKKLDKADPSVKVTYEDGKWILWTCGEVHLDKCIKDMEEDFAKIEMKISEPLVSFKETITFRKLHKIKKFYHHLNLKKKIKKKEKFKGDQDDSDHEEKMERIMMCKLIFDDIVNSFMYPKGKKGHQEEEEDQMNIEKKKNNENLENKENEKFQGDTGEHNNDQAQNSQQQPQKDQESSPGTSWSTLSDSDISSTFFEQIKEAGIDIRQQPDPNQPLEEEKNSNLDSDDESSEESSYIDDGNWCGYRKAIEVEKEKTEREKRILEVQENAIEQNEKYQQKIDDKKQKDHHINQSDIHKKTNIIEIKTPNQQYKLKVRAVGLDFKIALWLEKKSQLIQKLFLDQYQTDSQQRNARLNKFIEEFNHQLKRCKIKKRMIQLINNHLSCFGPYRYGPNLLINMLLPKEKSLFQKHIQQQNEVQEKLLQNKEFVMEETKEDLQDTTKTANLKQQYFEQQTNLTVEMIDQNIKTGFDQALLKGPLCHEPMIGVCFIVEEFQYDEEYLQAKEEEEQKIVELEQEQEQEEQQQVNEEEQKVEVVIEETVTSPPTSEKLPEKSIETTQQTELKEETTQQMEITKENNSQENASQKSDKNSKINSTQDLQDIPNQSDVSSVHSKTNKSINSKKSKVTLKSKKSKQSKLSASKKNKLDRFTAETYGPIQGQIMTTMKKACWQSFLGASPRLVEPFYKCEIITGQKNYGTVYKVLNKRKAVNLREEVDIGTNMLIVKANLPVIQSFGFYIEMNIETKGEVTQQCQFDSWRIIDEDPYFVPQTEDQLEEFGEQLETPNYAKDLIVKICKRKGILTKDSLQIDAEKQRTLSHKR